MKMNFGVEVLQQCVCNLIIIVEKRMPRAAAPVASEYVNVRGSKSSFHLVARVQIYTG